MVIDLHPDFAAVCLALGAWVPRRLLRGGEAHHSAQGAVCLVETAPRCQTTPDMPLRAEMGLQTSTGGLNR